VSAFEPCLPRRLRAGWRLPRRRRWARPTAWMVVGQRKHQKRVDGVLTLMTYTLFPDVTTSSLSITSASSGNPSFLVTQLGGGGTLSRSFPLYLEGNAAYSRYDPTFVATNGTEQREVRRNGTRLRGPAGSAGIFR